MARRDPQDRPLNVGLENARAKRSEIARAKSDMRANRISLPALMADPPPELAGVLLIDVIRWTRLPCSRSGPSLAVIGRRAVQDDVNLMLGLGVANARTRAWVAVHGLHQAQFGRQMGSL